MKIKFNKKMLNILRKKVRYYEAFDQMGGCFAYAEIVLLVDHFGVKETNKNHWYDYVVTKLEKGICGSTWFYFYPSKEFKY